MNRTPVENPNAYLLPEDVERRHQDLVESHMAQTRLLLHALENAKQQPTPFVFRVWVQGGPTRITAAHRGTVNMAHNPTAAPVTVILSIDGQLETAVLNLVVPANDVKGMTLPFSGALWAHAGNGVVLTGEILP